MTKRKAQIIKKKPGKPPKTQEFQGPKGDDALLWGDIYSVDDDKWAAQVRKLTGLSSPKEKGDDGKKA